MRNRGASSGNQKLRRTGFSLAELMIAMAIFMIVGAAGFSLLAQNQPIFNQQQNLAEVNIALRNAVAQMQIDIGNAGANYYPTVDIPNYPVGVVITNHPVATGGDCRTGTPKVYSTNCFDQMAIITADKGTLPAHPTTSTGACPTSTASAGNATIYLAKDNPASPGNPTSYGSGAAGLIAATAAAANYKYNGGVNPDQILFVTNDGSHYTTAALKAASSTGTIGGNYYVVLTVGGTSTATPGLNTTTNDPYNMSTTDNGMLTDSYQCTDWVLRLTPITYKVDTATDPNNPTLLRQVATLAQTTAQQTLATQVIGFKVGAVLFDSITNSDTPVYCFDSTQYDPNCLAPGTPPAYKNNYTVVRSVMVSLIGRTNPKPGPSYVFRNTFDGGPYEIQGVSVVINPRNIAF